MQKQQKITETNQTLSENPMIVCVIVKVSVRNVRWVDDDTGSDEGYSKDCKQDVAQFVEFGIVRKLCDFHEDVSTVMKVHDDNTEPVQRIVVGV